ncbi:MAG TPA: DCC1-like thiol-disulfide oxidoreductase family protein [Candidatus Kapabacteria bacterium]|nr:DCC1-like thiol-disulfide oxidoreductase family protein [Candidatus Kapabacteria bacterium]
MSMIILFDGVCNLCNRRVDFLLKHDRDDQFRFAALQSESGKRLLSVHDLNIGALDTVVLIDGDLTFTRSTAALRIIRQVSGLWKVFYVCVVIPKPARDLMYNLITKHRYKWFGRSDSCRVPSRLEKSKFIG